MNAIARELAATVFALHPSAKDRVVLRFDGSLVDVVEVPETAPARTAAPTSDALRPTIEISRLLAELATIVPVRDDRVEVMRDRVFWLPSVIPVQPPIP